jgi:hypothetical protein
MCGIFRDSYHYYPYAELTDSLSLITTKILCGYSAAIDLTTIFQLAVGRIRLGPDQTFPASLSFGVRRDSHWVVSAPLIFLLSKISAEKNPSDCSPEPMTHGWGIIHEPISNGSRNLSRMHHGMHD